MEQRWYVMQIYGPSFRIAERKTGPYYDETEWFCRYGYDTKQEAMSAISECLNDDNHLGPFFVMEGWR
jgi:hypothetical protein